MTARRAGVACAGPPSPVDWEPWAQSILPAWRGELEGWSRGRILAAVVTVEPTGRADLVLRVEEGGAVVLVVAREQAKGLRDPAEAKTWAAGRARAMAAAMATADQAQKLARDDGARENAGMGHGSGQAEAPADSEPGVPQAPGRGRGAPLVLHAIFPAEGGNNAPAEGAKGGANHESADRENAVCPTIHDIHCMKL